MDSFDQRTFERREQTEESRDMSAIEAIRNQIDEIDKELLRLINKRALHAMAIADLRSSRQSSNFSPEREIAILKELASSNPGPLSRSAIASVFSEIISVCRSARRPLKVAFLGPEGTFSHSAALKRFGTASLLLPQSAIEDIFHVVENGEADIGVTPVENSLEGSVSATLDQFVDSDVAICGEVSLQVRHVLLSKERSLSQIATVHSHPQALGQCRKWLRTNLPKACVIAEPSTAEAARQCLARANTAAIASEHAAAHYHLGVLARDIQDSPYNVTRFLLIGKQQSAPTGCDKTSLLFATAHTPGALHRALAHFAHRALNLTKIESRPTKNRTWEYYFFVDVEGHREGAQMREAIGALRSEVTFLKILGSYPIDEVELSDGRSNDEELNDN
uniref:Bifunctional chorismate mutase/prephenate dehydratase n=1 Tax=Desulfomonile tiedjei TaxID=2358 RepID=A0A7C4AQJ0_9BACT